MDPYGGGRSYDDHILALMEEEAKKGEEEEEYCQEQLEEDFKEEMRRSMDRPLLSPPDHGHPDQEGLPRPDFVLMDTTAYFLDRDNATTASCVTRASELMGTVKVTFCTAPPPLLSYYCVHTDFVTDPLILASETDGGLVLFCLIIGKRKSDFSRPSCQHWFMYDSGTSRRRPSLKHLPHPGVLAEFDEPSFAIIRDCDRKRQGGERHNSARSQDSNSGYRGPALRPRHKLHPPRRVSTSADHHRSGSALHPHSGSSGSALHPHSDSSGSVLHPHSVLRPQAASKPEHECSDCDYVIVAKDCHFGYQTPSFLWMYHSKTERWSGKPVQPPVAYPGHITCKTITIGEEVAWADLSRDIIFCDALAEMPTFRVVSLPPPMKKLPDPRSVRDVAILNGCIHYFELEHQINEDYNIVGWIAAKWSMKVSNPLEAWHLDHKVDSFNILGSSKIKGNAHTAQPNLQSLCLGLPNLSLQEEDVVYCLAKIHYRDNEQTAWVIAIDLSNNTIHEAVQFNAVKTVGISLGYGASRISKYLRPPPGTKQKHKRQGLSLLGCPNKK